MSTVATTRGPSALTPIVAETSTLRPLTAMHPDCLLLPQPHNSSSPRLSTLSPSSSTRVQDSLEKHTEFAPHAPKLPMEIDQEELQIDEDIDEENDLMDAASSVHHQDMDAVSVCSDTSVLSVGQEHSAQAPERLLRHPSAFSSVLTSTDCSDARSSVSTDEPATTPHCLDDDMQSQAPMHETPTRPVVMDPFIVANALRIPVPLVPRPNNSPFQEEFLRKSQLYAGEIMKQQMQLMAAARANAFALRPSDRAPPNSPHFAQLTAISKLTQFNAVAAAAAAAAAVVANNQKLTPSATHGGGSSDAIAQLSALSMQTQALKTVSSLNRLQTQMHVAAHAQQLPQQHNNNYHNLPHDQHEPALKFSIDNILKADFGRRMAAAAAAADQTLLLKQRRNDSATFLPASKPITTTTTAATISSNAVMDLSSLMSSAAVAAAASTNFSSSLANICTNSNDSSCNNNNNNNNNDFLKSPNSTLSGEHPPTVGTGAYSRLTSEAQRTSEAPSEQQCKNGFSASSTSNTAATPTTIMTPSSSSSSGTTTTTTSSGSSPIVWPAWVYCTRYSDRPSSGPRTRKPKKPTNEKGNASPSSGSSSAEDKRPRTAFSGSQLARLKHEFTENRYLTEKRRQQLSSELGLNEAQIKIWFQNKRAKLKKSSGTKNPLALQLMAQGLYNHSTVPLTREEEELQELQERERERERERETAATAT